MKRLLLILCLLVFVTGLRAVDLSHNYTGKAGYGSSTASACSGNATYTDLLRRYTNAYAWDQNQSNYFNSYVPDHFGGGATGDAATNYLPVSGSPFTGNNSRLALCLLVSSLQDAGLWDKLYAVYPFTGASQSVNAINIISTNYTIAWDVGMVSFTNHSLALGVLDCSAIPGGGVNGGDTGLSFTDLGYPNLSVTIYMTSGSYSNANLFGDGQVFAGYPNPGYPNGGTNALSFDAFNNQVQEVDNAFNEGDVFVRTTFTLANGTFGTNNQEVAVFKGIYGTTNGIYDPAIPVGNGTTMQIFGAENLQFQPPGSRLSAGFFALGHDLTESDIIRLGTIIEFYETTLGR